MSATKLYPSVPLETIKNAEERLEKTNEINSFTNSFHHPKEMITFFKELTYEYQKYFVSKIEKQKRKKFMKYYLLY